MAAYYNENDVYAAQWLRNLIAGGHIAPGDVDDRSITDVQPDDLKGYTQVHLFAGVGVWSYGLRLAGWEDDRHVWTGSCPCPPFSSAGKQKACPRCGGFRPIPHAAITGAFACVSCGHVWEADSRHLWPEFARLIYERRPGVVLGEQVASADGRIWCDIVCSEMEALGYAAATVDTCSACHGAPHIRQRLRFAAYDSRLAAGGVGDSKRVGRFGGRAGEARGCETLATVERSSDVGGLADADGGGAGIGGRPGGAEGAELQCGPFPDGRGAAGGVVNSVEPGLERHGGYVSDSDESRRLDAHAVGSATTPSDAGGVADARRGGDELENRPSAESSAVGPLEGETQQRQRCGYDDQSGGAPSRPGPTNGFWRDADWLFCTNGTWRPVEPGTFPLAHGATSRVGRLRAYGNAVDAYATRGFIEAVMESLP